MRRIDVDGSSFGLSTVSVSMIFFASLGGGGGGQVLGRKLFEGEFDD